MPSQNEYNRIILNNAIIPKSFYLIRDGYNTFTLIENAIPINITIPIGNYTLNEFLTQIQALLDDHTFIQFTYVMTFSKRLGKFTFTVINNVVLGLTIQPKFLFTTNVFEPFGFEKTLQIILLEIS